MYCDLLAKADLAGNSTRKSGPRVA
jgi:hypothetical protein